MAIQPEKKLTSEEYLAIERDADIKSEYFEGEIFAMAGAGRNHNLVEANIMRVLGNQLIESPCNVYPSDMRVKISRIDKYVYPDISVACDDEEFEDDENDTLLNPIVIMEILSKSTEAYDRGKKFEHYQYIDSFSEYFLISPNSYRVEQYVRRNKRIWTYYLFQDEDDVINIKSIGCELFLRDIYKKISS